MPSISLEYDKGTILAFGNVRIPNSSWDPRVGAFRTLAINYSEVTKFLRLSRLNFEDNVLDLPACPELKSKTKLRRYQEEALKAHGRRKNIMSMRKSFMMMKIILRQPTNLPS